jgi:hypothetical protein
LRLPDDSTGALPLLRRITRDGRTRQTRTWQ